MLKTYFKIAWRNLWKNKLHTGINLIGLTLGMGVSILIFFFIQMELSFDNFHKDSERIFRLERHEKDQGEVFSSFSIPIIAAPTFEAEFSQVEDISGTIASSAQAYLDESTLQSQSFWMVSPDFLEIFDFELISGDKSKVLQDKFSVVVTEDLAKKYFGEENPIGKSIRMQMGENVESYTVTGLLRNLPANTSLRFEMLMNNQNLDFNIGKQSQESWYNVFGDTYLKLNKPEDKASVEAGVDAMMKKVLGENYRPGEYYFTLQPLSEIHISEDGNDGMAESTRPTLLWILAGIAFLILLIACINFTTMAIGRSTTRAKEVGVRKTMGADFRQLVLQFLSEALLTTLMALAAGILLAQVLVPVFNSLFEKQLVLQFKPLQVLILGGLVLVITLMAGAYPAFFMSSLRPIRVLKGNLSIRFGKQGLRKALVAFQFFISFFLIASTMIMIRQMQAIREYDLGFNKEMVVIVEIPDEQGTSFVNRIMASFAQAEKYREALNGRSEIQSAAISIGTYGDGEFWTSGFEMEGDKQFNFKINFVGGDYVETMGLEIAEGRDFNPVPGSDSSAFLINETFAKAMNWEDPLGEMLPNNGFVSHQIVGVVKDFHHNSLYGEIEPVLFAKGPTVFFTGINTLMIQNSSNPRVLVKGTGSDFDSFKSVLESEWKRVFPLEAFNFRFMDQAVEDQYRADERLGKMVLIAASIAILIAAMGLFAMAALSIAGRTKEIGIRKVLGASSMSISWMFNKEFLLITAIGVFVALPLSLYMMQSWIEKFSVKSWPSWLSFGLLAIAGILFTLGIVSAQAYKATQMNPVKTLKDE